MLKDAGFLNLKGNLFDSAIMKTTSSPIVPQALPLQSKDPDAFEGKPSSLTVARIITLASTIRLSASTRIR